MTEIKLACDCGKVQGVAHEMNAQKGNRLTCCCSDCQAFAHYLMNLGRGNHPAILDQYSGTDIFQMPLSKLTIDQGIEQLACMRLSAKGLYRWYSQCCHTPIGNTLGPKMPFVGVVHNFMRHETSRVDEIGQNRAYVQTKGVKTQIPAALKGAATQTVLRSIGKVLSWKLKGFHRPSAFFSQEGNPIVTPIIKRKAAIKAEITH